jgi:hypothetical protein
MAPDKKVIIKPNGCGACRTKIGNILHKDDGTFCPDVDR